MGIKKWMIQNEGGVALIFVAIFALIAVPFVINGLKKTEERHKHLRENGEKVIAFYSHESGSLSSGERRVFEYNINNKKYERGFSTLIHTPPYYPYKEIPFLFAYDSNDPKNSVEVYGEYFVYRDLRIIWEKKKDCGYYMNFRKID